MTIKPAVTARIADLEAQDSRSAAEQDELSALQVLTYPGFPPHVTVTVPEERVHMTSTTDRREAHLVPFATSNTSFYVEVYVPGDARFTTKGTLYARPDGTFTLSVSHERERVFTTLADVVEYLRLNFC